MQNLLRLFGCLAAGLLLRRAGRVADNAHTALNAVIVHLALPLVGGLGNTSFVGLPMIESLHGRDGLGPGWLIDPLGSCLALGTVGVLRATAYAFAAVSAGAGRRTGPPG